MCRRDRLQQGAGQAVADSASLAGNTAAGNADDDIVLALQMCIRDSKKAEQKFHITHSKYIGGLKKVQYSKLMAENSDLAMTYAIKGMIPSNTIGAKALTRLHCYQGAEHAHAAQKLSLIHISMPTAS